MTIPLNDNTGYYWCLIDDGVACFESDDNVQDDYDEDNYYSNEIYRQRYLPKHIYEKDDYTMICVDTHTDGNKYLSIFDNSKKVVVD